MRDQRWEKIFLQRKILAGVGTMFLSMMFWWNCIFCRD